jgi:HEAT repeat protein
VIGNRRELGVTALERGRIERLRELARGGPGNLGELLAMRVDPSWAVRREVIAVLGELGDSALPALSASLSSERDDETRIAATVDALVASAGNVDEALEALAADATAAVRADVAQILGRRRNPASIPRLAELARNADDNVAVAAIEGLGRVGGRAVVDELVRAVESRSFFRTFAAIDVLGKSSDPRAIAPLGALLDNPHFSFEAARALGRTGDRAATGPLSLLVASPIDSLVRVAAQALLDLRHRHEERFGTTAPIDGALVRAVPRSAARRLVQCASGADTNEQVAIYTVLGCLGDEAAGPALLRALDGPAPVARAAAEALERISSDSDDQLLVALWEGDSTRRQMLLPGVRSGRATDAIIACLNDPDAVVRRLACEALGRIGSGRAVPDLFEVLDDSSAAVVQAATSAIVSLGHQETPALAARAARSPLPPVRRAALRILSLIGSAQAFEVLAGAVRDAEPRVREAAIIGLSLLEVPEALSLLLTLAENEVASIRAVALRALGDGFWRDTSVGERLSAALQDSDAWVRYYACQAIGKLKLSTHVEPLATRVGDPAGQVRVSAIEALSHLPGDTAFAVLLDAAQSDELDLRRAALIGLGLAGRPAAIGILLANAGAEDAATRLITLSALANIEAPETLAALRRAARDPDESVRMAAIGFLGAGSGTEAVQILAGFLLDPVLGERARAVLSTPHEQRVAGLSSALQTANDELAVQLTGLLARLNRADATAALFEALTLPNAAARRAAATTLGAIGSREALAALQRLSVDDPDPAMRRICALILVQ